MATTRITTPKISTTYLNYIGGEWVESASRRTFEVFNPATEDVLALAQDSNGPDIDRAVRAAHQAFQHWSQTSVAERASTLLKIADTIEAHQEELAYLETLNNGKPIRETLMADIPLSADHFRYFASVIRTEEDTHHALQSDLHSTNLSEPLGVIGQIIPWNFPLLMAAWKLAPALATGNTVVLKPAEQTPLSVLTLAKLVEKLLPPGVLNIVTGFGPRAGAPLVRHPLVAKVAFTGSSAVGRLIAKEAAETMKPVTLELGGKSPNIVFSDAPLSKAIEGIVLGVCFNQGEVCTCGSRALVHEEIFSSVAEKLVERFKKVRIGNPLDTETQMGAQVSREQMEKILNYIEQGQKDPQTLLLTGGRRASEHGYFIQPTLFKTHNKSIIAQEEIFGPVLSLIPFKDEAEAIQLANDTIYGLGAGLWTRDAGRIHRMTKAIRAGRIWVNNYHAYPAHAPFGGMKESGFGRETHKMMLGSYRQTKNIITSFSEKETGLF